MNHPGAGGRTDGNAVVTGECEAAGMRAGRGKVGACVVRVEAQPYGMLISLRMMSELTEEAVVTAVVTGNVEEAVEIVRKFLKSFIAEEAGS
ncbi:hypothetical protein ABZ917_22275 [Nonomuraea wenchangensis]